MKISGLWNFSLLNYESKKGKEVSGIVFFCKCGLLLWLVCAQHVHYESKCGRNLLEFLCEQGVMSLLQKNQSLVKSKPVEAFEK